jgi:hypothetical protein
MSMNFAREQSLLRQRLQAKGAPDRAAALQQQHGSGPVYLGASDDDVATAATELAAAHPQMGRAQMTAFVRTLWNSKIHELRAVGVQLLAARAALLEPHDLPLLEGFLDDQAADPVQAQLARDVLGPLVVKSKKLWKDLKRYAQSEAVGRRRAAMRASVRSLLAEADAFARFADLAAALVADPDPALQQAIDEALLAACGPSHAAAQEFATRHGRSVKLPKPAPVAPPPPPPPIAPPPPVATAAAAKPARSKPTAAASGKPARATAGKAAPATKKPAAGKAAAKPAAKKPVASRSASRTGKPGSKK